MQGLVDRLLAQCDVRSDEVDVVVAGPAWTKTRALLQRLLDCPRATWLDGMPGMEPWEVGATGALGCVRVLDHFAKTARGGVGLVVTSDPLGCMTGLLIRVSEMKRTDILTKEARITE